MSAAHNSGTRPLCADFVAEVGDQRGWVDRLFLEL
jgi:hypothetical protein